MCECITEVRVRYNETDKMQIVYHGNYTHYFDIARSDFLKMVGLSFKDIEEQGFNLPVSKISCRYISPAKFDDVLIIKTKLTQLTVARCLFTYEVLNKETGNVICVGKSENAFLNSEFKAVNLKKKNQEYYNKLSKCIN